MELTAARALLLSRTVPTARPAAFPFTLPTERVLKREGGAVAAAAVLMAIATTANVIRHWNDRR